jgi:signal transduction histidine kinase
MSFLSGVPLALCNFAGPHYLIFSENVPALVYYSHIPITILAFLVGLYVLFTNRASLANKVLFFITTAFSFWVFLDSVFWATNRSDVMMYVWSLQILFEPLVYAGMLYLLHVVVDKQDIGFNQKLIIALLCAPVIALVPTHFSLPGFNPTDCLSIEGFIGYYDYFIEIVFALWIVMYASKRYRERSGEQRKEIVLLTTGAIFFLIAFASGNLIGSLTGDWDMAQVGLFGMPIFIAFLAYSIVRFQTFNVRLIGAQALVLGLAAVTGAQFFFIQSTTNYLLNGASFLLVVIFGFFLIRSVKREIKAKESLQVANAKLKDLDKQKTEFISFATHQLRSPLTSMRGNASMILEGDLGPVPDPVREAVQTFAVSTKTMVNIVDDYLNVSRIELGTMKYDLRPMDFKDLLRDVMNEQKVNIEAKGLKYSVSVDESQAYPIKADPDKFKQVVMNVIDNSSKYTPQGSIDIALSKDPVKKTVRLAISDTGVGIRQDVIPKLFQKFTRAPNASEANIHGTGLGLFIAKEIMTAHGGRIWAESAGEGKGSQFYIELPEA